MKRIRIKWAAFCALIVSISLLGGCWSNIEINELAFVMGVAVDLGESADEYEVTVQVPKPGSLKASGGGDGGGGDAAETYENFTDKGIGMKLVIDKLRMRVDRRLHFGHNQVIVISSDVAQNDISPILDFFVRSSDGRFTVSLFIVEGKAKDALDIYSALERLPIVFLQNLLAMQVGFGETEEVSLKSFLSGMVSKTTSPVIPVITLTDEGGGKKKAELYGLAAFKDAKLHMLLSLQQAKAVLQVRGRGTEDLFQINAFGGYITLRTMSSKVDIASVFTGGVLEKITVNMEFGCSIADMGANADILSDSVRNEIAEIARAEITGLLQSTLAYTQLYNADVFGFGEHLYRYHPRLTKGLVDHWAEEYPRLNVEFSVSVNVLSTGTIILPITPGSQAERR